MTFQIAYDDAGNFQYVQQNNDDGTWWQFGPGSTPWDGYVAKFGVPPATGTPTNPRPSIVLPAKVQSAIAVFQNFKRATPAQQNSLTGPQIADLFNASIDAFNWLNNQLKNS